MKKSSLIHLATAFTLTCAVALSAASCADDNLANGSDTGGDKGATVSFNVSDAQNDATAQPTQATTRAAFAQTLASQGLAPEDLVHQKLVAQSSDGLDACLIESTVAGVNPMMHRRADSCQDLHRYYR